MKQFAEQFPNATVKPVKGQPFTISLDDVFASRRAAKTVLNEAAYLARPRTATKANKKGKGKTQSRNAGEGSARSYR
ncbi:MAG: hypothetical protein U0R19_03850 [Bryobacteraceae bacterium]